MTGKFEIKVRPELIKNMLQHAYDSLPYEACGIISGKKDKAVKFYPARNELKSQSRYNINPDDLYRIIMDIEEKGLDIWGIFHSHPASPAYPSDTDLNQAFYPDAYYLIASFMDEKNPGLRAFLIRDRRILEVKIETD